MTILASLQNINLAFGDKTLFDNTGFEIHENEKVGLIGLNGKGKSTLLKIIESKLTPDTSHPPFRYDKNRDLSLIYIPQELNLDTPVIKSIEKYYLNFYPDLLEINQELENIEQQMSSMPEDFDTLITRQGELFELFEQKDGWSIEQSYQSYLKKFDLSSMQTLQTLSGGEGRKIALSVGLSAPHKLVLWDEPTNHLDLRTIEVFEEELANKSGTFIMISHDRYILSTLCNTIYHINRAKIVKFKGNYLDYTEFRDEQERERLLKLDKLENSHRRELAWMRQGIKARGTRSKKRVEGFNNIEKDINLLKSQRMKKVDLSMTGTNRKTKILFEFKEASFAYKEESPIFKDVDLKFYKGDRIALVGKNGAGKSTLLKILTGKLKVSGGKLKMADDLKINYFSQNRVQLDETKTPLEVVADGQDMIHLADGRTQHVNAYLEKFLFTSGEIRRPISTLSGGEKNRLQLAMFMKDQADVWIFDEPTNDLDIETIENLEDTLITYKQAVIIVSHDRSFLDRIAKKCWIIQDSAIEQYSGNYTDNADILTYEPAAKTAPIQRPEKTSSKSGLNNKEKARFALIEDLISEQELKVIEQQELLANFNYETGDPKELEKTNIELKSQQSQLDALYNEWEILQEKA